MIHINPSASCFFANLHRHRYILNEKYIYNDKQGGLFQPAFLIIFPYGNRDQVSSICISRENG